MNKTFWINFLLSLLIIAMFLLQFTPELEPFKYWICFVVVMSTIVIIVNTFNLATKFSESKQGNLESKENCRTKERTEKKEHNRKNMKLKDILVALIALGVIYFLF